MIPALLALALAPSEPPIKVRVLVVNYNPIIEKEDGKRLNQVLGWNDPKTLTAGYIRDMEEASGGRIDFEVVEWRDVDEWPKKKDGFRYTDDSFLSMWRGDRSKAHQPDEADYLHAIESQKVVPMVDSRKIDEFWIFSFPYSGHWEAAMAGPGAYFINGGVYDQVQSKRRFAIMGFSYERGVAEMIHNTVHRTENHMKRAFGRWEPIPKVEKPNLWEKFSAHEHSSPGHAAVGNCHFPPNGEKDYDYANPRIVQSTMLDWRNYPRLTGKKSPINKDTWGGPDYQRNYLKLWFSLIPRTPGLTIDGQPNDWWKLIYQLNDYR